MGQLISLNNASKEALIYFRNLEYYSGQYHFLLKKEYPYAVYLHRSKTFQLVTIREIMEQQCRSIAIYCYVEMDYQYPNQVEYPYGDTSIHRHGYYVIRCQLEEDQMILKLKVPELDKPQILCPQNEDWHRERFETYDRMCLSCGLTNNLSYQWEKLNKILQQML